MQQKVEGKTSTSCCIFFWKTLGTILSITSGFQSRAVYSFFAWFQLSFSAVSEKVRLERIKAVKAYMKD